ncbi:glycosyltransferase involved in cell wall biosynthesis [Sphingomonas kaistensis]|uniref:Glycosyltransferase involved in cell wall biosynthesis n=1 Tax=Sphingomonas kaistensis TaxID=298708 RepID=A0A7X6BH45_9SPHN|nr:glycosyltransferase involved in cell wall biosynthesis [Sphingomonas kaistensis]
MTDTPPILLVANSSWNLSHQRGGLIRAFQAEGRWPLEAVVPLGDPPVGSLPTYQVPLVADGTAPRAELKSLVALIALFRQVRPGIVLGFTPKGNIYAGLAARATRRPFLPNVSGLGTGFIRGGLLLKIQAALYREAFRGLPTVFFQNRDDAALFEKMGLVTRRQVALIPGSGVDCRAFTAPPPKPRSDGRLKLVFVGRLLGDKGVRELAGAMRRLKPGYPGLSLTLVGELGAANRTAVSRQELDGWVGEGLLTHAGRTDDVRPFIAAADAVILPSYREGMPRALLEAAAMSRPLLASDVPGCREIVRDGDNGLLFEVRSEEALASAIERFITAGPEQRRSWALRSREIAEREYDERLVIDAYRSAVIALTGKGR